MTILLTGTDSVEGKNAEPAPVLCPFGDWRAVGRSYRRPPRTPPLHRLRTARTILTAASALLLAACGDRAPSCGVRYLRATHGTPYRLKTSVTWRITWRGSDGAGGGLPDGVLTTGQDVTVQEIQSVNR
ncbi:hypothetical protein AB0D38_20210 [Streptomyces sp. NPDC048279]|uniref:hypothetical protein n=1 Tax=Streptomyces sp. NPDC048279 TaxID=3154714 RepID=UPI00341D3902